MIGVELPDELVQVGLALGVLRLDRPGDPASLALNPAFFGDPSGTLAGVAHDPDRREALLRLAASLFGEVSRTLDLPALPPGQTWIPLVQEGPAALCAIVDAAPGRVSFGLGGRAATERDGLRLSATLAVPVAGSDGESGVVLLPGTPAGTIRFGIALDFPPAGPDDVVALAGVAVMADLPTAGGQAPALAVRLRGLRLPAWPQPRDLTLTDDPDLLGAQLVEVLHGLLETRAGRGDDDSGRLRGLLALLGLGDREGIPPLPLAELFSRGPAALVDWLRTMVSSGGLGAWLQALAELLELDLPDGVLGTGTAADPLRWVVRPTGDVEVSVQMVVTEAGGAVTIRPAVAGSLRTGDAATLPGRLRVLVELCALTLAATPAVTWLPRFDVGFELSRDGVPLVRLPATGTADVQVGTLRAGIGAGADHRPALQVEAIGVMLRGTAYPTLDLSSVEAIGRAASAAAADALTAALDDFLEPGRARALAVLLGLTRPVPVAETWPGLPALPELIADPLGAWGRYQAAVLSSGRWGTLAGELARLLGATAVETPAGDAAGPWVLRLAGVAAGELELRLWRSGPDAAPVLHVGAGVVHDPVALNGAELRPAMLLTLARIELPAAGPVVSFADGALVRLEIGDDLEVGGPIAVRFGTATAVVEWRRETGWEGRLAIRGGALASAGETLTLPDPFELGTGLPPPGDDLWTALEWLLARGLAGADADGFGAVAAALLGWRPTARLRLRHDPGPGIDVAALAADLPPLRLDELLADPVGALRSWLARLMASDSGLDLADLAVGVLQGLVAHDAAGGGFAVGTRGTGTPADPWRITLGAYPSGPELLAWLDPDGPSLRGLDPVLDTIVPGDPAATAAEILTAAARFDPLLRDLSAGRDVVADLAGLLALRDSDGIFRTADQIADGDAQGATLDGVSHLDAPAAFELSLHAPGVDGGRVIYVAAALPGVAPWRGQPDPPDPALIDLREGELPASATVAAQGPWFVLLPPVADVAGRLRAAVQAVRAAAPGPVTLVAHSVAGHAARAVWAGGDAEGLVTVGCPYGPAVAAATGAEATVLAGRLAALLPQPDAQEIAGLLGLLRARAALCGAAVPGPGGLAAATPFPVRDFLPPPLPTPLPGAVAPLAIPAGFTGDDLVLATAGLARAVAGHVRGLLPDESAGRTRAPATHLGLGIAAARSAPESDDLRASVDVRADLHRIRLRAGGPGDPGRAVTVRTSLWREGGWLAGSAAGGSGPRVRRADLTVVLGSSGAATMTLHDAAVAGIELGAVRLGAPDAAARTLIGALGRALSPAPATGLVRDLLDVLAATGLIAIAPDGTVTFPPDALDRFLTDPMESLRAGRELVVDAAGRLLASGDHGLSLVDDGAGTRLTAASTVLLGGLVPFDGTLTLDPDFHARAQLRLGPLVLDADSRTGTTADIELDAGRPAPDRIPLWPTADLPTLGAQVAAAAAAEVLRAGLEHVRGDRVDPLLRALGLLPAGTGRVRSPIWLLRDPIGWPSGMLAPARLAALLGAAGRLIGQSGDGLALPGGGSVTATEDGDALRLTVRLRRAAADGSGADVALLVSVAPGLVVRTGVRAAIRRSGTAGFRSAGVELEAGLSTALTVRLQPADPSATELVLPLLPGTPDLGALAGLAATAAVEHALPVLLDALGDAGDADPRIARFAAALTTLGEALGLRDPAGGTFRITELRLLAADPPAELASRFRARPAAALAALRELVAAVTGDPAGNGPLWRSPAGAIEVDLAPAATGAPRIRIRAAGLEPLPGLRIGGEVTAGDTGLAAARLSLTTTDADALLPGPVDLLPFVEVTLGADVPERVEAGVWLDPVSAARREALLVQVTLGKGTLVLHRRATAAEVVSGTDLTAAIPALVKRLAVPLAAELALAQATLGDLLNGPFGSAPSLGGLLAEAGVLAGSQGSWRLAGDLVDNMTGRVLGAIAKLVDAHGGPTLGPFELVLLTRTGGTVPAGSRRYGVGLRLTEAIVPPAIGPLVLAVEADDVWDPPLPGPAGGHLELWVLELPDDLIGGVAVRAAPGIRIRGLGVRVRAEQGPLLDAGLRVGSLRLSGAYEQDASGFGHAGGRLVIDGLALDVGSAGGGNPVAGKVLSPGPGSGGDPEKVAPSFSPELQVRKTATEPVRVTVSAGLGSGPWWIPIQRSFGPIYIAQIGLDVGTEGGRPTDVSLLLDGGAALSGLEVGVDDLELIIPFATAANPLTWRIDLAGLAVAFHDANVELAGGLRKLERDGGVEYVGMLVLRAAGFGIDVIGAWGEFPVPGKSEKYTSLFIFGALSATLGGPPAFFVTGVGAGLGINRGLTIPDEVGKVNAFPLVRAMSSSGGLTGDPMRALNDIAAAFPPLRGNFWLAAGVRFTTFTIVESVAMLAVSFGDGVEVAILGTSRMGLPNPAAPLVSIELALLARFSSRDGVLSVQAQLTANSWLINPACRLTGGFAFMIWFRTGEVLLTLGGFHSRFIAETRRTRPHIVLPQIPRLGLSWQVSSMIVVKGESYFALTSTAVMTGARIQVVFDGGFVKATFTAGFDAVVSWDPAYYDVTVFIGVTASLNIEINLWFLGTIRIWLGFSIGAELHVWGPRIRGEATLDLGVVRVRIPFGPGGRVTVEPIGWGAFHDKYLVAGDPHEQSMSVVVAGGSIPPDPGGPAGAPDDGSAERPFRVGPEFTLATSTRTAANRVNDTVLGGLPLDLTPMQVADVTSRHTVAVVDDAGQAVPVDIVAVSGAVPDGLWRIPEPGDVGADGMHPAFTGARIVAVPVLLGVPRVGRIDDVEPGRPRRLPLLDDRDPGQAMSAAMAAAAAWAVEQQQADAFTVSAAALAGGAIHAVAGAALGRCLGVRTGRAAAAGPSGYAISLLAADRLAPPRLARITTGAYVAPADPVPVVPRHADPPAPGPRPGEPLLAALLWSRPAADVTPPGRTTVGSWGRRLPRRTPPSLAEARFAEPPLAAHLHVTAPPLGAGPKSGLAARDVTNRFRRVGDGRERRRELLADRGPLLEMETRLAAAGVSLPAGQAQVWHVPQARADVSEQRPALSITGDQLVRVVTVGRDGTALTDAEVTTADVTVPRGAQRLVLVGTGRTDAAPGLAGWYAGTPVLRAHPMTCLVPGGLLRAAAAPELRNRTPVDAALTTGADAVRGSALTRTTLPAGTRCVLLVLDTAPGAGTPAEGLILGLDGATQQTGADGRPAPPVSTVAGYRTHLFFTVRPEPGRAVVVTVGHQPDWQVAGVLGSARPAALVAAETARRGLEALVPGLTERGSRASQLRWIAGSS
ncbi:DUF6603 domain-containing protein [Actinoplanes sp. NBRC 103695]|uniref:DUF6603 domain-containing protein n=1 Tax=Actinoplanes sp. NBRC 103695 TaxID=3032202 RepID=UPI0024A182A0|nr:DUF6603 domain-containing protein [Actinoplanes sp. NBRC 103695]GLY99563.1 hypothetical protein Acsp02_68160 [Actinoplanes sp. NBRC 103695]